MATDEAQGFLLDRGFQVINTSYPALPRHAPRGRLQLRPLPAAATVLFEGRLHAFGNPLRSPRLLSSTLLAPFAGPGDLARLGLAIGRLLASNRTALDYPRADTSAAAWLDSIGLSGTFIDAFLRPFFGGVLLDPGLTTSARCLRFDLRQFALGSAAVPARGMRALPELMAERLGHQRIRLETEVAELLRDDRGGVVGVGLATGEEIRSDLTIVATAAPAAARLTGPISTAGNGEVCVHIAVDRPLLPGGRLLLDPTPGAWFMNAAEPSAVAPGYAPTGQALVMLIAPGRVDAGEDWSAAAREALHGWFPALPAAAARVLRVDRIEFGVMAQPPGIHPRLRPLVRSQAGLVLAGEPALAASLNAALIAGERAARPASGGTEGGP
ncbi:MAG: NAD(P)/FAD-dependent oxidoreductase [Candidatus Dormibacteraceae bacterium]